MKIMGDDRWKTVAQRVTKPHFNLNFTPFIFAPYFSHNMNQFSSWKSPANAKHRTLRFLCVCGTIFAEIQIIFGGISVSCDIRLTFQWVWKSNNSDSSRDDFVENRLKWWFHHWKSIYSFSWEWMKIWKIRISFRLWPLNEEENNEWILLTSVCRSLSARPPLSENQLSGKIIESAHSMSVRAGACYKMWTAQWRLPITMKSIFTLIIKYVVSSCICHIHVLHICHGIHSFRGILRNDSSGESSVLTFFMPINSTIITFYCAFIFIEKCLIVKSAHEHTFHPYRDAFERHFINFPFHVYSCLPAAVSSIYVLVICIEGFTQIHTKSLKHEQFIPNRSIPKLIAPFGIFFPINSFAFDSICITSQIQDRFFRPCIGPIHSIFVK